MPDKQKEAILQEFSNQIENMPDSIKEQSAIAEVKSLYENLNVDTDKLQNDYILLTGLQMLVISLISMISAVIIVARMIFNKYKC